MATEVKKMKQNRGKTNIERERKKEREVGVSE